VSLVETALGKLRAAQAGTSKNAPVQQEVPRVGTLVADATGKHAIVDNTPDSGKLIAVDRDALRAAGFLPESAFERRMADQYRQIKRPLISQALAPQVGAAPDTRLIAVASALPGDGKTFTSINMALSMSRERDVSVLLVDADVAKPHVSRLFGVDGEPGLLDALADPAIHPESLVIRTDIRGLFLLPAGKPREGASELLSSARLGQISKALLGRDPRRILLFDSSPLMVASESRPLVESVGQVVLVVRASATPKQAVLDAVEILGPDKRIGIVLNQSQSVLSKNYYGYGDYGAEAAQKV
jgi:exopolysaccharide/PEP-CTERM locus tyrosine autokinase